MNGRLEQYRAQLMELMRFISLSYLVDLTILPYLLDSILTAYK